MGQGSGQPRQTLADRSVAIAGFGLAIGIWAFVQGHADLFVAWPSGLGIAIAIGASLGAAAQWQRGRGLWGLLSVLWCAALWFASLGGLGDRWRIAASAGILTAAFGAAAFGPVRAAVVVHTDASRALVRELAIFAVGMALGVGGAVLVFVPWLGCRVTIACAAGILTVALLVAWRVWRSAEPVDEPAGAPSATSFAAKLGAGIAPLLAAVLFGGAASLCAWLTRLQMPVTAYTAGAWAFWLLLGLAFGWWLGCWGARKPDRGRLCSAGGSLVLAVALAALAAGADSMAQFSREEILSAGESASLGVVAVVVAACANALACGALGGIVLGATFGAWTARCCASNDGRWRLTFGAGGGAVAVGIALCHGAVAWLGLSYGLVAFVAVAWAAGVAGICAARSLPAKARGLIAAAAAVAVLSSLFCCKPSDEHLVSVANIWPPGRGMSEPKPQPRTAKKKGNKPTPPPKLLFSKIDERGWLAVIAHDDGTRQLVADGAETSSTEEKDSTLSALLAHIPCSICSGRGRALLLGQRDGGVLATLNSYGFKAIDCVDSRPSMRAAAQWLGVEANVIPKDAPVRFSNASPLSFVSRAQRAYDVIVSCPRQPWEWGAGGAFCREYFDACRRALGPSGAFATFVPLRGMAEADVKAMMRTFAAAFEQVTAWVAVDHIVLVGWDNGCSLSLPDMAKRMAAPAVRKRMKESGLGAAVELWSRLLMTTDEVKAFTADARLLRWGKPRVELRSARCLQRHAFTRNFLLAGQYRNALFERLALKDERLVPAGLRKRLGERFDLCSVMIAQHADVQRKEDEPLFEQLLSTGRAGPRIPNRPRPGPGAYKFNGIACYHMGFYVGAYRLLNKAFAEDYRDPEVRYYLGAACVRVKKYKQAFRHLRKALEFDPKYAAAYLEMAWAYLATGRPQHAIDAVLAGLAIDQDLPHAHTMLGFIYTRMQAYDRARLHFRIALVKDPNDKEAAESLKVLAARQSNDKERERLEERLRGLLPKPHAANRRRR